MSAEKLIEIKAAVTAFLAVAAGLLGNVGVCVAILAACMVLDYITGSLAAKLRGEWSSAIARAGLWHKLGEIVALLVAALCDIAIKVILSTAAAPLIGEVHYAGYLVLIVSIWYIFTELGSILENAAKLGAPIPAWMIQGIQRIHKKTDQAEIIPKSEDDEEKKP